MWTIQIGVFPEKVATIALYERCSFRIVGTPDRIGQLNDVSRDFAFLVRRSPRIRKDRAGSSPAPVACQGRLNPLGAAWVRSWSEPVIERWLRCQRLALGR